jgi:hypothetical protein
LYRPHLSLAVLCEKVLREADGVISAIRIVDRLNIAGPTDEMPPTTANLTLLIGFKSGFMRGAARVKISPVTPAGQPLPTVEFPVYFEGDDDRGVVIAAAMVFVLSESGLYWFDVALLDEVVTRIPLRVVYQKSGVVLPQS